MSTVIENQIVQMSFDNKEFERNISASMKSLDQFKENMEFDDSARNFKDLEKASESIDFEKLNKAIDGVADHFTLTGRVFFKITDQIADYFTSKLTSAVNAVKSVTTDIIDPKAGYAKYDQYTHGVKTILSALSDEEVARLEANGEDAIVGVEAKLAELMAYTDETSYNFVDMVSTIGKFLGAGLSLDSAVADMQGIANWAALAGQNATIASQAMYQMSQALGAGYVKYMDWTQMANLKNMGTTAAKDTFINAAMQAGTITQEDINHAKKVLKDRGQEVTDAAVRNWFFEADQLNNEKARWFTTEVLEKGLHMFSSVSDAVIGMTNELETSSLSVTQFLRAAKSVKKDGKSVKEAMDGLAEAGLVTAEEYDKVYKVMQKVTSAEYELGFKAFLAAQEAVTFSEAVEATKDAVSTGWMQVFNNLIGNYEEAATLWTNLANDMWEVFAGPLQTLNGALVTWKDEMSDYYDENGKQLTKREALWMGLAKTVGGIVNVFKELIFTLTAWTGTLEDNAIGFLDKITRGLNSFGDILAAIASSYTLNSLGDLIGAIYDIVSLLIGGLWRLVKAFLNVGDSADTLDDGCSSLIDSLTSVLVVVHRVIKSILDSKGFAFALRLISKLMAVVYAAFDVVAKAVKVATSIFNSFAYGVFHLFGGVSYVQQALGNLGYSIVNLISRILELIGISPKLSKKLTWPIVTAFSKLGGAIDALAIKFYHLREDIKEALKDSPNFVVSAVRIIVAAISKVTKMLLEFLGDILGFDANSIIKMLTKIGNKVMDFFAEFASRASKVFNLYCFDIFHWLPQRFEEMLEGLKTGTVPQKVEAVFSFIGACLRRGVGTIIDAVGALIGVDLTEFKDKVLGFLDAFTDQLSKLNPGWEATWQAIVDIFWGLVGIFKGLASAIFWIIGEVTGIENMGPDKIFDLIGWILEKLVSVIVFIANGLSTVITTLGPLISSSFVFLKDIFKQLWMAFTYLIGADRSSEALDALNNVKSVIKILLLVLIFIKVAGFFKAVKNFMNGIGDIADAVTGQGFGNVYLTTVKLLRNIALLLLAIAVLANQDFGSLVGATAILVVVLEVICKAFIRINNTISKFVKDVAKTAISEDKLKSTFKYLAKLMTQMSLLMLITVISLGLMAKNINKYGASEMILAVMALTLSMMVLVVGVKGIIKAAGKLGSNADAKMAGVTKLVIKVSAAFSIISLAFRFLIASINKSIAKNGGDDTAVLDAMMIMSISMFSLVAGTLVLIKVGKQLQPKQLEAIGTAVYKTMAGVMFIAVALAILLRAFDFLGVDGGGGGSSGTTAEGVPTGGGSEFGIRISAAFGALVGTIALMAIAITIINKLAKKDMPAKAAKASSVIAETISSLFYLTASMQAMVVLVAGMIGTFYLLYLTVDKMDIVGIGKAFGLTVALFFGGAAMIKLLSKIKIEGEWRNILAFSVALVGMSVAILAIAEAFAILIVASRAITWEGLGVCIAAMAVLAALMAVLMLITNNIKPKRVQTLLSLSVTLLALAAAIAIIAGAMMLLTLVNTEKLLGVAKAFAIVLVALAGGFALIAAVVGALRPTAPMLEAIGNALVKFALSLAIVVGVLLVLALIEPIIDDIMQKIINTINALTENMPDLVEALMLLVIALISSLAESIGEHADELAESILNLIFALADVVLSLLGLIFEPWMPVFEKIGGWFANLGKSIANGFSSALNAIKNAGKAIGDVFIGIWNKAKQVGADIAQAVKDVAMGIWGAIQYAWGLIKGIGQSILDFIKEQWDKIVAIKDIVFDVITGFPKKVYEDGLLEGLKWLGGKVKELAATIWDFFTAPFRKVGELGTSIIEGLWKGISDKAKWIYDKITEFCKGALGKIKKFFGINSPSKVMSVVGDFLMQGLSQGISGGEGGVLSTVTSAASNILGGFTKGLTGETIGIDVDTILDPSGLDIGSLSVDSIDYGDSLAFDPSAAGLSSVYSMDVVPNYNAMGGMDIPTNFQPTIKDSQLEQITDAETTGTQDIVDAIHEMRDELTHQAEIISKFQMVLDSGVLVGELVGPMDKALGNRAKLATGRGV